MDDKDRVSYGMSMNIMNERRKGLRRELCEYTEYNYTDRLDLYDDEYGDEDMEELSIVDTLRDAAIALSRGFLYASSTRFGVGAVLTLLPELVKVLLPMKKANRRTMPILGHTEGAGFGFEKKRKKTNDKSMDSMGIFQRSVRTKLQHLVIESTRLGMACGTYCGCYLLLKKLLSRFADQHLKPIYFTNSMVTSQELTTARTNREKQIFINKACGDSKSFTTSTSEEGPQLSHRQHFDSLHFLEEEDDDNDYEDDHIDGSISSYRDDAFSDDDDDDDFVHVENANSKSNRENDNRGILKKERTIDDEFKFVHPNVSQINTSRHDQARACASQDNTKIDDKTDTNASKKQNIIHGHRLHIDKYQFDSSMTHTYSSDIHSSVLSNYNESKKFGVTFIAGTVSGISILFTTRSWRQSVVSYLLVRTLHCSFNRAMMLKQKCHDIKQVSEVVALSDSKSENNLHYVNHLLVKLFNNSFVQPTLFALGAAQVLGDICRNIYEKIHIFSLSFLFLLLPLYLT